MDDRLAQFLRTFRSNLGNALAVLAATVVISSSAIALLVGRVELGLTLAREGQRVIITSVTPGGAASREGFAPGMVVVDLNGQALVRLPEPEAPVDDPNAAPESAPPSAVPIATSAPLASGSPSAAATPTLDTAASPAVSASAPLASTPTSPQPASTSPSPSSLALAPVAPVATPSATPAKPTIVALDDQALAALLSEPVRQLDAMWPSDLAGFSTGNWRMTYLGRDYVGDLDRAGYLLVVGLVLLVVGGSLLRSGRLGQALRPLAVPLAVATSIPLLAQPLHATWSSGPTSIAAIAVPFGIAPLGLGLARRIEESDSRGVANMAAVGAAILAVLFGVAWLWLPGRSGYVGEVGGLSGNLTWIPLAGGAALIPGVLAGLRRRPGQAPASGRRIVQSNELAVAGATPLVALATSITSLPLLLPLSAWLGALALAGRWTVRPLVRVAARATLQRDLIVAATEAERARVAAEIHDDALQELTLLVRRLDAAGDADGAAMARTVSDRLRAICGDLRLPILDDLGVGPALDWLAERMERLAGGAVHLERVGDVRLPPDVELAFFRIAQEAVSNAVKHGKPPIAIRFRATAAGASLSVDDAGAGIDPGAVSEADGTDRFGILNMQQRAEQIGALLDIRPWPSGGTHVALEWRAP